MNKFYFLLAISFLFLTNNAKAQLFGCTDSKAANYNASATNNDGSCIYNLASIAPLESFHLDSVVSETSGLIMWNNYLWTHNDSGGNPDIYALDTLDGALVLTLPLNGTINVDWEEISQDCNFIYIGDFGNNISGNRTDLKILRISKNSILANLPIVDTIRFSYSNQSDFDALDANKTDFDCEAFIVSEDSVFLFTKQWVSGQTSVYSLPKTPGSFVANLKSTFDVQGLVTGAVYLESKELLVLCGYSKTLQPFAYLLYDFNDSDFFSGNKRKINLSLPFHQVEGITTTDGLKYYVSNESFPQLSILQKLHIFDFTAFLDKYLTSSLAVIEMEMKTDFMVYPVPAKNYIIVETTTGFLNENYVLVNQLGEVVIMGKLTKDKQHIDISALANGMYLLKLGEKREQTFKVIKNE